MKTSRTARATTLAKGELNELDVISNNGIELDGWISKSAAITAAEKLSKLLMN